MFVCVYVRVYFMWIVYGFLVLFCIIRALACTRACARTGVDRERSSA